MLRWEYFAALTLGIAGFGVIGLIIRWLNPPPKPPEDEWQKWSDD